MSESPTRKRLRRPIVTAPDLGDVAWLGLDAPPDWRQLAGHVVVLDVFSTSDVASLHALDDTRRLVERFADEPVVVFGVHAPRFAHEAQTARLVRALDDAGITWPVACDDARRLWERYAIKAWPSRVVVDPDGYIVGVVAGEAQGKLLTRAIEQTLERHRRAANLAPCVARHTRASERRVTDGLHAPRGLAVTADGTLFVADAGRVLEARPDVDGRYVVQRAWRDGLVEPRGLAVSSRALFVADRAAHVVHAIDLAAGARDTLVGRGTLGAPFAPGGPARDVALRSPWGLAWCDGRLVVAPAGDHRLWLVDVVAGQAAPWVGRGTRRRVDADAARAAFDQPCGLATDEHGALFVADAGSCAVREVDPRDGATSTLAGGTPGDADGPRHGARLQWPTAVAAASGVVYVADTLNDRLRVVARRRTAYRDVGHVATLVGQGGELAAPSAVVVAPDGRVIVADTGNDRLVVVDPVSGAWDALVVDGA